jgi:serine/threonine-protein kinase
MSVHDSRRARAAAGQQDQEEPANETSTIFEWPTRQQAAKNEGESLTRTASFFEQPARQRAAKSDGENLTRTASFFEQPARQRAAKNERENLDKTSMIFERPPRQQAAENQEEPVKQRDTVQRTADKTMHRDPFETGANVSREPRLNDNHGRFALRPQRSTVGQHEPQRDRLHVSSTSEAQLIGRTLANKYTIESVIGTGSMGTIYRARQIALDKWVSVKILHRELAEQRNFVERFKLEAFSASRLEHPNSLRVLDFGEDGNLLHLVMEYVEADDLLTVMQRAWPFKDSRVVEIMSQALAALAKAHEVGIVHRDLKPENILILRGTDDEGNPTDVVKVCDFGIAKMAGASAPQSRPFAPHLTTEGLIVGTPDYMSPEQARGEGVDGRSDLYSMGVVLYQLLAGRPPFMADTPFGIAIQHVSEPPLPPSRHRAVNPVLESICLRAMNKRPEDRFQTAREMRRAILSSLAPDAESAMPAEHGTPTRILSFPAAASSVASPELPGPQSAAPIAFTWPNWVRTLNWPNWARRPNAVVVAAALATIAMLALVSLISRLRGDDSSSGGGNVVRTATVALAPAAQPSPASSAEGADPAPTQPQRQTPSLLPDDTHAPIAPPPAPRR